MDGPIVECVGLDDSWSRALQDAAIEEAKRQGQKPPAVCADCHTEFWRLEEWEAHRPACNPAEGGQGEGPQPKPGA